MPRNAEVIRQWTILRDLESSRRLTIDEMAARTGVTTRTIRRDLEALQEAGFPLFDEVHEGKRYWTLEQRAFRRLDETGFNLAELSALYVSRTLAECLAATPFQQDVRNAFDRLAAALTPGMRQFLDRLPLAIQAKADPGSRTIAGSGDEPLNAAPAPARRAAARRHPAPPPRRHALLTRSRAAARRTTSSNRSVSSSRRADCISSRSCPSTTALRTFSIDRILHVSVTEERFEPQDLSEDAFAHSLGVHQGTPETIEIAFEPRMARYVKERIWHPSQEIRDRDDGGLVLTLRVTERLGAQELDSRLRAAGARGQPSGAGG